MEEEDLPEEEDHQEVSKVNRWDLGTFLKPLAILKPVLIYFINAGFNFSKANYINFFHINLLYGHFFLQNYR